MSRAFVSEDRHEEPIFVPPRAPLPEGVANYVTQNGLSELHQELKEWEIKLQELSKSQEDEAEYRREANFINDSMSLLKARIVSANLVTPTAEFMEEVRFAAIVDLKIGKGSKQSLQIVGVDEAEVKNKKIAFTSPLARAILGKKVGETVSLNLGNESRQVSILGISY